MHVVSNREIEVGWPTHGILSGIVALLWVDVKFGFGFDAIAELIDNLDDQANEVALGG